MADHLKALINNTPDLVLGPIVLVFFLTFAYGVGRLLSAVQNARFTQAWAPLIPIISGTILNDSSHATSSRLTGTYGGRSVEAEMTPGRNMSAVSGVETDRRRYNEFEIRVLGVSGGQDWHVFFTRPLLGLGKAGWSISADGALGEKLESLGVLGTIERMGGAAFRYRAQQSTLEYRVDVTPRWAPTPERFREDLEALLPLAQANEEVNPA